MTAEKVVQNGGRQAAPDPLWVVEDGITVQRGGLSVRQLLEIFAEEARVGGRTWHDPGFRAIVVYRFGVWAKSLDRSTFVTNLRARFLSMLYLFGQRFVRNHYGIEIHRESTLGRGVEFVHQHGIQIFKYARIGDRTRIMHDVTLGSAGRGGRGDQAPTVGSDVVLGTGARIMGKVSIGDGARIGPNVVIYTDIPAGATVVAPSPRVIYAPNTKSAKEKAAEAARQAAETAGSES